MLHKPTEVDNGQLDPYTLIDGLVKVTVFRSSWTSMQFSHNWAEEKHREKIEEVARNQ